MRSPAITLVLTLALLTGCASTPDWAGMSEDEIASWRAMDLSAAAAQQLTSAGLDTGDVTQWREAGVTTTEAILAWNQAGWKPESATPWVERNFSLEAAMAWAQEKFTAEQARTWVDSGFDLSEAVANRDKGLTPVK